MNIFQLKIIAMIAMFLDHIAYFFKNGGLVVRLRKLIVNIFKLNALGIPPVCKAANPVLIHSFKRYAVLRRMGLPVAL